MMALRGQTTRAYTAFTVTFASGSPTSNAFSCTGYAIGPIEIPSGFSGFALGAQIATAGGTHRNYQDTSGLYGADVSCILPTAQLDRAVTRAMPPFWVGVGSLKT